MNNRKDQLFRNLFLAITEAEYRKLPVISYSAMSSFDREGPKSIIKKVDGDIPAFAFGSLVDELLLEQDNNFDDKFYMFNGKEPTASSLLLAKELLKTGKPIESDLKETTLKAIKRLNLWKSMKDDDKVYAKVDTPEFWKYIDAKFNEGQGKFVIDTNMWGRASKKVSLLKGHPYTAEYFNEPNSNGSFTQLKAVVELYGTKFKFMTDLVTIDHDKKIIYPKDLKTGAKLAEEFNRSFYEWRYWIQGGMYRKAIVELIKGTYFEDYEVAPFEFIYINSWAEDCPITYIMPVELEKKFSTTWINKFGDECRGYEEIMNDLSWHRVNREYDYSRKTIENNGRKILT
jgi:hypothetical protein